MTKEAWEDLLQRLPQFNSEDALFEIYEEGGQSEGGFIRANKEGILLVAGELLQCLRKFEEEPLAAEPKKLPLEHPEVFADGWIIPDHLELLPFKRGDRPAPVPVPTGDGLDCVAGWLLLIAFFLLSMIVGMVTIIRWLFS